MVLALVFVSFAVSPWPSIILVRAVFDRGAAEASRKLEPHLPASVTTTTHNYDPADPRAVLDIHRTVGSGNAPTVVWVHGGGFVSGRRGDITNYAKVLAGHGFTVVNVDYTIAPEAHYPEPVRQVNQALAYLSREGAKLGVNPARMVLAGDSAGAQIAAQSAAVITNPEYAKLVGVRPGATPQQLAGTAASTTFPAWDATVGSWGGSFNRQGGLTVASEIGEPTCSSAPCRSRPTLPETFHRHLSAPGTLIHSGLNPWPWRRQSNRRVARSKHCFTRPITIRRWATNISSTSIVMLAGQR